jgi:hypothetical protein
LVKRNSDRGCPPPRLPLFPPLTEFFHPYPIAASRVFSSLKYIVAPIYGANLAGHNRK